MSKLNPIERSRYINKRYKEYLNSSFEFETGKLQKLFEKQLETEELFKGPYVDLNLPFKRGKNINELIEEGIVCKSFLKLGDINFERPLYAHQEEAIRRIGAGRSAIITTGTGSGKTESFLYPILNELMSEVENGNREVGIRAVFLYPMNALVNDQIERVRKILTKCPDITYGFFTGDTAEKVSNNYREKYGIENDTFIPMNELVSRKEIRENPPHLLFTNYSMLEYLLIRPNDYSILEPSRLVNWKYVVLDEAHTYNGSLGIELSLLMRRLTGLAPKKPRFILTSATLGEQGKSEGDIINFARSLTSATFDVEDIIFAKRIPINKNSDNYTIKGEDYLKIKESIKDVNALRKIGESYTEINGKDIRESLYDLLIKDDNVFKIYNILKNGSKNFNDILEEFNGVISTEQLIALIDLINQAEKNGIGIFDLKYHSFVRPLSGAYITLGNEQKLSLTKTNMLDGLKAFEIGNCRYCGSPYIIGKIYHNEADNLDYLLQNNEVDIYENYGDNEFVKLDYFLMENAINENNVEQSLLEKNKVCSRCGTIYPEENLNARKCSCGESFLYTVYKVLQANGEDDEKVFNNINKCPCCGHKGNSGIVKSLNIGKDEGTAIIAQTLLEAMDDETSEIKKERKLLLKLNSAPIISDRSDEEKTNVKQFLAFSDSRQQASFAATFFDSKYMKMLCKRLIWKVIEDYKFKEITVDEMAAILTTIIKEKNLFSNNLNAHKNAWVAILIDLLKIDGNNDCEGLGLYYFDLDLSTIMDKIDEEDVQQELGKYGITKSDLETIMQVVFSVFKTTPAINYTKSTLTPDEKKEMLEYRRFDNYVMYNCPKSIKGIRSFLPVKGKNNSIVHYVQKIADCDEDVAKKILQMIFFNLALEGELFKKHESKDAYQIDVSKFIIKNYKISKYYKCLKCGKLTPYNVHNLCVQDNCNGKLIEVNPDSVLANNWYRNQYKRFKIEKVVIKEHTAQLERKTAKQYQQEFKNKQINILSCSTTFEMGIDIGNLETVFMRNVPPSPANYVQRAGRAGRRKDSSAYILTYCSTSSHDYTYFVEPEKMISGVINPPYFNVVNKKIIIRHLMASYLGFFFRHNPDYFKNIDSFAFGDGIEKFNEYILSYPEDLNNYINEKVLPGDTYSYYHDFKWFDEIGGNDEKMEYFIRTIREIAEEYEKAKQEALTDEKYLEVAYYTKQIEKLHNEKVIDLLSKYCVIPKYGFPVDVVELQIYKEGKLDNNYDLTRDLRIAISEYAPDSEIIVDGKKYTSKYITLPKTSEFTKHYFVTCTNCNKVNVFLSTINGNECKGCGESLASEMAEFYIEPVYGFKSGITKESTRMKPKRSYAGEVSYLGGGKIDEKYLKLGNTMLVKTSTNDELLIINKSNFYMCPKCGYSELMKKKIRTPQLIVKHKNYRMFDCGCEELDKIKLGHSFQTDVTRFTIPHLETFDKQDYAKALSFMYAFLEGISIALGIERNDIDGILEVNLEQHSYDILIYDNVPGGAGHSKRLVSKQAIIDSLNAAHKKVSQKCCDESTSCYNCLRNYYNQMHHSKLQRKYAREIIEVLLREIE